MSETLTAVVLGVVQGLTEFIPVSSSGHLVLAHAALGFEESGALAFDAVLHLATAFAVVWFFRRDIVILARGVWGRVRGDSVVAESGGDWLPPRYLLALALGTVPAVAFGLLFETVIETSFRSPLVVAGALVAGSALFVVAEQFSAQAEARRVRTPAAGSGLVVGLFQTLALVPGVSRSGATISGGLLLGFSREEATRFAFLLSVPVLFGAGLLKLFELVGAGGGFAGVALAPLVAGSLAAFATGLFAIRFMVTFLRTRRLYVFAVYRVVLALLIVLFVSVL